MLTVTKWWAGHCAPCKLLKPHWDRLVSEYKDRVTFTHCDISVAPGVASTAGVQRIPTVTFLIDGKEVARYQNSNARSYHELKKLVDQYLPTA